MPLNLEELNRFNMELDEFFEQWEKEKEANRAKGLCESCGSHPIFTDNLCDYCAIPYDHIDEEISQEDLLEWMGIY